MQIKGYFKRHIFKGDNNYLVGLFKVRESLDKSLINKTITFTGYFDELNEIDLYILTGEFTKHSKYGQQFKCTSYEVVMPDDKDHIVDFLSSYLFKGIGGKKALKIVDTLGNDCLTKILDNPNILLDVDTVTEKQKDIIYEALLEYNSSYNNLMELTKIGFTMKDALRIEKFYQTNLSSILENPYQITLDLPEITFIKLEKVRSKLNIEKENLNRVSYGIIYVLENLSFRSGNTYFSYSEVLTYSKKVLEVSDNVINEGISNLIYNELLLIDEDKYYLTKIYDSEKYIANRIVNNLKYLRSINIDNILESEENLYNIKFNKEQKKALWNAINADISIISGGPGTGKTTLIREIVNVYQKINKLSDEKLKSEIALLAPTGRASKRISYQTNFPASTIHRFLKWNKEDNSFAINEYNKSNVRYVIIDEVSMLDNDLFYNLLLGLKEDVKLVLIGDYNQLPSVGAGQVLKDILETDVIPTTYLTTLYRQEENSNINILAHDIINNNIDFDLFNENDDLTFVECNESNLKEILKEFIITYKDMSLYEFQVLCPTYKGDNGIDSLNSYIQDIVNEKKFNKDETIHNGYLYRKGDKVINLVNSVDDNVFNGDIGEILKISTGQVKEMLIDFDYNIVKFNPSSYDNLRLGYTISIHKAQGSEFSVVILPILNSYGIMLYKKLIYTGITRAKDKLIILGEKTALEKAILIDRDESRKTSLKKFIIDGINL